MGEICQSGCCIPKGLETNTNTQKRRFRAFGSGLNKTWLPRVFPRRKKYKIQSFFHTSFWLWGKNWTRLNRWIVCVSFGAHVWENHAHNTQCPNPQQFFTTKTLWIRQNNRFVWFLGEMICKGAKFESGDTKQIKDDFLLLFSVKQKWRMLLLNNTNTQPTLFNSRS